MDEITRQKNGNATCYISMHGNVGSGVKEIIALYKATYADSDSVNVTEAKSDASIYLENVKLIDFEKIALVLNDEASLLQADVFVSQLAYLLGLMNVEVKEGQVNMMESSLYFHKKVFVKYLLQALKITKQQYDFLLNEFDVKDTSIINVYLDTSPESCLANSNRDINLKDTIDLQTLVALDKLYESESKKFDIILNGQDDHLLTVHKLRSELNLLLEKFYQKFLE
jgi:hypothetical protein